MCRERRPELAEPIGDDEGWHFDVVAVGDELNDDDKLGDHFALLLGFLVQSSWGIDAESLEGIMSMRHHVNILPIIPVLADPAAQLDILSGILSLLSSPSSTVFASGELAGSLFCNRDDRRGGSVLPPDTLGLGE